MDGHIVIDNHKTERFLNYAERIFEKSSISKNRKKRHKTPDDLHLDLHVGWNFVTFFSARWMERLA